MMEKGSPLICSFLINESFPTASRKLPSAKRVSELPDLSKGQLFPSLVLTLPRVVLILTKKPLPKMDLHHVVPKNEKIEDRCRCSWFGTYETCYPR